MNPEPKPELTPRRCEVKECGALVYHLPVNIHEGPEGGRVCLVAVDLQPVEVIIPDSTLGYRRVAGYRPHGSTCVDITGRLSGGRW